MRTYINRYVVLAMVAVTAAVLMVASPALVRRQQVAHAEQVRARCVREFSAKRAWRADITETETGSDGASAVTRQQLLVRKPGEYRLTLRERDSKGREVTSTTIRTKQAFYTRRANPDGSTELHIIRGVRPSLGVELDNLLGQTVQAVADATPLRVVGTAPRNGAMADKLELGPGRFVWVDQQSGLPVEEQVVAGGSVAHSVAVNRFDGEAPAPDTQFDPASLGAADATTVEDLGFRPVARATDAIGAIGFDPLEVATPVGFVTDVQGFVDPLIPNGDGPVEAAFVSAFSQGASGVLVTQVSRQGAGDSFLPADDGTGSMRRTQVAGQPAALFDDTAHPRLVFVRRDVLVTIEGNLTESAMRELAEGIR